MYGTYTSHAPLTMTLHFKCNEFHFDGLKKDFNQQQQQQQQPPQHELWKPTFFFHGIYARMCVYAVTHSADIAIFSCIYWRDTFNYIHTYKHTHIVYDMFVIYL